MLKKIEEADFNDMYCKLEDTEAVWFSKLNFFQYREKDKVRVWNAGSTVESIPEQATSEYIEIISD